MGDQKNISANPIGFIKCHGCIPVGARHTTLAWISEMMYDVGVHDECVAASLDRMNKQCEQPLSTEELEKLMQANNSQFTKNWSQDLAKRASNYLGSIIESNKDTIETNEKGGKQARLDARFDLICPVAMQVLAEVLDRGAKKYGVDNWKLISVNEHLNHALYHVWCFFDGQGQTSTNTGNEENHLAHAFCRMMMAVSQEG